MDNIIIHSDNFTDSNGDLHYFNTGRDNISGINYPTHYINNEENYIYTRILNIKLSTDTMIIYPIYESFLMTLYTIDNTVSSTVLVNINATVKNGSIIPNDIKITCIPLTYMSMDILNIKILGALKSDNVDGNRINTLGIWVNNEDIINISIKNLSSMAYNEIPNNIEKEYLHCDYIATYLDNENVIYDENMRVLEEGIGEKIAESKGVNDDIIEKVNNFNADIQSATPDYQYLSVLYDDLYKINNINTDEIITPTGFQYVQHISPFVSINNNAIQVNETGNYLIALKVNMMILDGASTDMNMSIFINNDRIDETTTRLHLNPDTQNYPLGFLSGQFRIQLKPSDKVYLKVRWTNKNNVNIENHCTLQITKLNKMQ